MMMMAMVHVTLNNETFEQILIHVFINCTKMLASNQKILFFLYFQRKLFEMIA